MEQVKKKPGRPAANSNQGNQTPTKKSSTSLYDEKGVPKDYSAKPMWAFELINFSPAVFRFKNPTTGFIDGARVTICYSEEEDSVIKKNHRKETRPDSITAIDGLLTVSSQDQNLLNFLFFNQDFNKEYRLIDNQKKAIFENESRLLRHKAVSKAYNEDQSTLKVIANVYGLSPEITDDEMRNALASFAEKNPEEFLDKFDNEVVRTKSLVVEATRRGLLDLSNPLEVKWQNGGRIIVVPTGQDPTDYFANYLASGSEAAMSILKELEDQV